MVEWWRSAGSVRSLKLPPATLTGVAICLLATIYYLSESRRPSSQYLCPGCKRSPGEKACNSRVLFPTTVQVWQIISWQYLLSRLVRDEAAKLMYFVQVWLAIRGRRPGKTSRPSLLSRWGNRKMLISKSFSWTGVFQIASQLVLSRCELAISREGHSGNSALC